MFYASVSKIADQFYCEYKVWLKPQVPDEEFRTEQIVIGSAVHQLIETEAPKITPEELKAKDERKEMVGLVEQRIDGSLDGVSISGKIDALLRIEKKVLFVVDYKTTYKDKVFEDTKVQLGLYGLLLEQNDFVVNDLVLMVVMLGKDPYAVPTKFATTDGHLPTNQEWKFATEAYQQFTKNESPKFRKENWLAHLWKFDANWVRMTVGPKLEVWRGERDPKPTESVNKCRAC